MKSALLTSVLMLGVAWGQAPAPAPPSGGEANEDTADTPNRAVARISIINGVVSVRRGDSGEAVAAALNAPLTSTDRLLTGEGSRAEIQFDAANMIRLAPSTEVRLGDLAYHQYQVQVANGTTLFRVLRDSDAQVEISTPSIAVRPLKRGVYRITVKADGSTEVTVRSGEAEIASPKGTEKLGAGKTMQARGTADNPEFQVTAALAQDQWDEWNLRRDQDLEKSGSGRYVNPDINGTEELDANGRWVNDPAYGQVWVPTVDPGWAPYQVGRWVWVDYYGWTWVSGDPWGWAPYHYGRWYNGPYGWAWWPGAIYGPYYWRPALVGFFGWGGPGIGIGFGFGNVGWVALAPFERFSPWYGPGIYGRGFGAVNIARNVNVTNIYRNARVSNGVTSIASNQFGRAGVNGATNIRAGASDLARAGAVRGAMPIAPSRESTHFSNTAASSSLHSSENSHFYSSRSSATGSSANHVSFDQQRNAMTRPASSTGGTAATHSTASPAVHNAGSTAGSSSVNPTSSSSGNTSAVSHRPVASTGSTAATSGSTTSQSNAGAWQRFNGNNAGTTAGSMASGGNRSQGVRINPSVVQSRGSSSSGSPSGSSSAPSRGASSGAASSGSRGGGGSSRGGGGGRR